MALHDTAPRMIHSVGIALVNVPLNGFSTQCFVAMRVFIVCFFKSSRASLRRLALLWYVPRICYVVDISHVGS